MKCCNCGQLGHPAYRCYDIASSSQGKKKIFYAQEEFSNVKTHEVNLYFESIENLMLKRVLIREHIKGQLK